MSPQEKKTFCKVLKDVKVPDGYSSDISRSVHCKKYKLLSLKSHDCRIIMQQLLPLAVRRTLPKDVSSVLIELSEFFRILCSSVNRVEDLERLENRIPITLCHLERIFPPSFFDIMIHLAIHLPTKA